MCKYVRHFNMIIMASLIIIEGISLGLCSFFLFLISEVNGEFDFKLFNSVFISMLMLKSVAVMLFTFLSGMRSLYYKLLDKINMYICCCVAFTLLIWVFYIINDLIDEYTSKNSERREILDLIADKEYFLIVSVTKTILHVISLIFTVIDRKEIKRQLDNSPLNYIDSSLDEELYNNILRLSKNPDDASLMSEHRKLTFTRLPTKPKILSIYDDPQFKTSINDNNTLNESTNEITKN